MTYGTATGEYGLATLCEPVQFVRGFFNASLTPTLARERGMRPALYADVDGDLYSSGLQCLDWLFCSGLIQAGRTVIRYDDWLEPGRNGALMGEQRAHREITMRHQVRLCLGRRFDSYGCSHGM